MFQGYCPGIYWGNDIDGVGGRIGAPILPWRSRRSPARRGGTQPAGLDRQGSPARRGGGGPARSVDNVEAWTAAHGTMASQQGDRRAEARGQQLQRDWNPARRTAATADDAKARMASSSDGPGGGAIVGEDDERQHGLLGSSGDEPAGLGTGEEQ
ncbi:hypothetical protein Syun_012188 [Stephania yunnanensis]|uniref:Uncharacterized protein n=1 Tax=Stephania yunnanensis TaxID=152371 RepID=A0AAP0K0E0_9MAGN